MARPSSYDPAYCDAAVEFMAGGYSITAFAGHVGVTRSTVFAWMNAHPEFQDSVKRGTAAATKFWEAANIELALTGKGNATACIFGLKNRASEDWKDIQEHRHEVTRVYDFNGISDTDLAALESIVRAAGPAEGDTGGAVPSKPHQVH